jgi:arylsulfatase A-like enzyme
MNMVNCKKPNVILINCDDLGYGDLGCFGSELNHTPILDNMCANGLKLTDFYMPAPICTPSRGGMLTGCYPPRIGFSLFGERGHVLAPGSQHGLSTQEETMGTVFKKAGYATGLVGKWHVGDQPDFLPCRHGFDFWYGLPVVHDQGRQKRVLRKPNSEPIVMPYHPPLPLMLNDEIIEQQPDLKALTERFTARAVEFITAQKENPFFLYLAHIYTHRPLYVQDEFINDTPNGRYGAAVKCLDWSTGVLLETLKRHSLEKDTLIIFTSDNGSRAGCPDIGKGEGVGSNGILRGVKCSTYEGGIRMPFIAYWPGTILPRESSELLTGMDLLPTFAHLIDVQLQTERKIDGINAANFLLGMAEKSPRSEFAYYNLDTLFAVRQENYKLHVACSPQGEYNGLADFEAIDACELYNLASDPGETNNIAKAHPELVQQLSDLAERFRQELGDRFKQIAGSGKRPCGFVENAKPLTEYIPEYPYFTAEYDMDEFG